MSTEERTEQIHQAAKELVDIVAESAGDRAAEVRSMASEIELAFEVAVVEGDPAAFVKLEDRMAALAELARIHLVQGRKEVLLQSAVTAARIARAILLGGS